MTDKFVNVSERESKVPGAVFAAFEGLVEVSLYLIKVDERLAFVLMAGADWNFDNIVLQVTGYDKLVKDVKIE